MVEGLLLAAVIPPTFRIATARLVLERLVGRYDRLQVIWADGAYGGKLVEWAKLVGGWSLELVRRPAGQHTFQVLPRRWVVERTFGWFNLQRRLSKDYEALCETTETWLYIAMTGLILRRLADFSYKLPSAIPPSRRGLRRAAAPTVQGGSVREYHPGTPN